ncbi:hypothetical protein D3C81_1193140 [compost metagenome]
MAGESLAIRVGSVFCGKVGAVWQQDAAQLRGAHRAVHAPPKAVSHQQRQITAVVDVGMGQHHGVEPGRIQWQWVPVAQAQVLVSLEQPTIHQYPALAGIEQVLRAGDRIGRAEKLQVHGGFLWRQSAAADDGTGTLANTASLGNSIPGRLIRIKARQHC